VVVTGGVVSGIGKGVTASSIGVLLKMMGMRPTAIKIDPYLNVDAGTMSPFEHGKIACVKYMQANMAQKH
jgi:CTP synthase